MGKIRIEIRIRLGKAKFSNKFRKKAWSTGFLW